MSDSVLFVGGGRRWQLASCFEAEGFHVACYETDNTAPLCNIGYEHYICEHEPGTRQDAKQLQEIYNQGFSLIVPLYDSVSWMLTKYVQDEWLKNVKICMGPPHSVFNCYDKMVTAKRLYNYDFYPRPVSGQTRVFKRRYGCGSNGVKIVPGGHAEILSDEYVSQQYIDGQEYTVDTYFTKQGRMLDAVPRKRIRVGSGEVMDAQVCRIEKLRELTEIAGSALGIMGPACIQWIEDAVGKFWFVEANARFGGGSTLSLKAGFNMIELVRQEYIYEQEINGYFSSWRELAMKRVYKDTYYIP